MKKKANREMTKKMIIEFSLLKESKELSDSDIIKGITDERLLDNFVIPWSKKVEKIKINEGKNKNRRM